MSQGLDRQAAINAVVSGWCLEGQLDFVERCFAAHEADVARAEQVHRTFNRRPEA